MRFAVLILLAGCDQLFGLAPVHVGRDGGADAAAATVQLVQQTAKQRNNAALLATSFVAPPQSGDVILVIATATTDGLQQLAGGGVKPWQLAARSFKSSDVEIWYGVTDGTNAPIVITETRQQGALMMALSEWRGLDAANLLDASDTMGSLNGTAPGSTESLQITTHAPDLVVFATSTWGTTGTPTPGTWLELDPASAGGATQNTWDRIVNTPAMQTAQTSYIDGWDAAFVGLRAAP